MDPITTRGRRSARGAAAVAFASFLLASPLAAATNLPALVKKTESAIVTIVAYDETGEPAALGTGFFVDDRGHLITNHHVLEGSSRAEVKTQSGKVYPIESILADDEKSDVMKVSVKIPKGSFTTLKMTRFLPDPGERVIVIGSPYGLDQTVSDGIVSTVREVEPGTRLIQITAPISPGSSGSPVMNESGTVLGIATVTFAAGQNLNFAVPSRKIVALRPGDPIVFTDWAAVTYEKLGLKNAMEGDWDEAIANFHRAVKTKPDYAEGFNALGMALQSQGQLDDAFKAYREAIRLKPDYADAHYRLATLYQKENKEDEAVTSLQQALRLDPDHAEAVHDLALIFLAQGNRSAALDEYKRLKDLDEKLAADLFDQIYGPADANGQAAEAKPAVQPRPEKKAPAPNAEQPSSAVKPPGSNDQASNVAIRK